MKLDSRGATGYGNANGSWIRVRRAIDMCTHPIYLQVTAAMRITWYRDV